MIKTEEFIKELSKDTQKVKRISPVVLFGKWIIVAFLTIAAILIIMSRHNLYNIFTMPMVLTELTFALATGLLAALAAFWLSTPDVKQQKWVVWLPFIPFVMLCSLITYNMIVSPMHLLYSEESSIHCPISTFSVALIPAIVLMIMLKFNANTHSILFSIVSVMAVAAFGYFCSRLICYKDNIEHLLIWHYTPIMLFSIVAAIIGSKIFRWK